MIIFFYLSNELRRESDMDFTDMILFDSVSDGGSKSLLYDLLFIGLMLKGSLLSPYEEL